MPTGLLRHERVHTIGQKQAVVHEFRSFVPSIGRQVTLKMVERDAIETHPATISQEHGAIPRPHTRVTDLSQNTTNTKTLRQRESSKGIDRLSTSPQTCRHSSGKESETISCTFLSNAGHTISR